MSTNLTFATCGFSQGIRFVLVNNRVPRTDERCALCGGIVEQGYVRDSQTRLIYCNTQCFRGAHSGGCPPPKITSGKCHEMTFLISITAITEHAEWLN